MNINNIFTLLNEIDESLKKIDFEPFAKSGLKINYTKESFISNVINIIKPLAEKDSIIALGYFDFAIIQGELKGFPFPNKNEIELDIMVELSKNNNILLETIQKLKPEIEKFSISNYFIIPENNSLERILNEIIKIIPEFITTVGKVQHRTHAYTLDIHILKTMQNFINNDDYELISTEDQNITKLAILLHDIGKKEFVIDRFHPERSSFVTCNILNRIGINSDTFERINNFVLHHQWVRDLEENAKPIKTIAEAFRRPGDFHIAIMLTIADLNAIGNGFEIGKENTYLKYIEPITNEIMLLNKIQYQQ